MASLIENKVLRMNQLLKQDKPVFGTFQTLKSVRTSQIICNAGFDAIILDCEHGNLGDSDMHDSVAIIAAMGVAPLVRVRGDSGALIKRALDTGAHGIMIPMVSTAEDARRVVNLAKFPPIGIRGQGSPFAPFAQGFKAPYDYVNQYNANTMIMGQIETAEAIKNVEEIAQVEGLDMLFVGPNDLALSMLGYVPSNGTEKVYLDAIDKVVATAKKYGKKTGILVNDGASAKKIVGKFDFIVISNDAKLFGMFLTSQVAAAKA